MIKFGPNRYNSEEDGYDPPLSRMLGDRFTIPQVEAIQTSTPKKIRPLLGQSDMQKDIDGLVHDMQNYITIIEQQGDRGKAQQLRERIQKLQSHSLNEKTMSDFQELHQHIVFSSQNFDE